VALELNALPGAGARLYHVPGQPDFNDPIRTAPAACGGLIVFTGIESDPWRGPGCRIRLTEVPCMFITTPASGSPDFLGKYTEAGVLGPASARPVRKAEAKTATR
jgi:hypothetical protein